MTSRERANQEELSQNFATRRMLSKDVSCLESIESVQREGTGFSRTGGVNDSTNVLDTRNDSPGCAAGAFEPTTTPVLL